MSENRMSVRKLSFAGCRTIGSAKRLLVLAILLPALVQCTAERSSKELGGDSTERDGPGNGQGSANALPAELAAGIEGNASLPRNVALDGLSFRPGSSTIPVAGRSVLEQVSIALQGEPGSLVRVVGYGDGGDRAKDAALGLERAEEVKGALMGHGVAAFRIETVPGETGTARRVTELVILSR